jgi:hypothetical protein
MSARDEVCLSCCCRWLMRCAGSNGAVVNYIDTFTVCPAGSHSTLGKSQCSLCAPGFFNPAVGQAACTPCPTGSFNQNSGSVFPTACLPCPAGSFCGPSTGNIMFTNCSVGTYNPVIRASSAASCLPCPAGSFCGPSTGNIVFTHCSAGTYNPVAQASSVTSCLPCPAGSFCGPSTGNIIFTNCSVGTYNPVIRASSAASCLPCPAGSFCGPSTGNAMYTNCSIGTFSPSMMAHNSSTCQPCQPGTFNSVTGQSDCNACPAGSCCPVAGETNPQFCQPGTYSPITHALFCNPCAAGMYSSVPGSFSCNRCFAGTYCPIGSSQQCRCPINSYVPPPGDASTCMPCVGQAVPATGQSECVTEVAVTGREQTVYKSTIGIFAAISLCSVCLVVILVRSRHAFSVRPFHSGICVYIASFSPYALLKAVAVSRLLEAKTQDEQLTAGLMLNGTFMMFFWLGFGGKMALIQLWMHLISRHTSGESEHLLMESARRTWRFMRVTVLVVCVLYGAGFISLVGVYAQASSACSAAAEYTECIPFTASATPPACQRVVALAQGIVYYEGVCAAVVVVVFTFYALMFNGLVYAMLTSDATFSNLTRVQRLLISNSFLRWMLRPYASAHRRFRCDVMCFSHKTAGLFRHHGGLPPIRRRATWNCGAPAYARSASSSPSSVCAASRARPCWWR